MEPPFSAPSEDYIEAVRSFNRSYTRAAGLITDNLLDTPHSLTEARVIFEVGAAAELPIGALRDVVALDAGYLSRVVSRLEDQGLLRKRRSEADGRIQLVSLTPTGQEHRASLDGRSAAQVAQLLQPIAEERQDDLVAAMRTIDGILSPAWPPDAIVLRAPGPGDLGWIVQRHGALYAREYGWGLPFEALVARVIAEFAATGDDPRQAGWIATLDGQRAGAVLCAREEESVAKLRLLLVEPAARGHGIGRLLVDECICFARDQGYSDLVLWTNDVLTHARPIYEAAGFELVDAEPHRMFGPEVVGQNWRLALT